MTSWRDVLPIHPAAELFPLMSPEDIQKTLVGLRTYAFEDQLELFADWFFGLTISEQSRVCAVMDK